MEEYNDVTDKRLKTKYLLNLDDSDFIRLSSKKGLLDKIFNLVELTIKQKEQIDNLSDQLTKTSKAKTEDRFNGVQKLDKETLEVIETYETMKQAAKENNIHRNKLSKYFFNGDSECAGFKWKKLGKCKTCQHCGKVDVLDQFAKRFVKNGVQYYKSTCLDCYSKGKQ